MSPVTNTTLDSRFTSVDPFLTRFDLSIALFEVHDGEAHMLIILKTQAIHGKESEFDEKTAYPFNQPIQSSAKI